MAFSDEKLLIAVQGTEGAYSQLAAKMMFPNGTFLYFKNFDAVARAVNGKMCRYGVLPIENNTYGSVKAVYKILRTRDVAVVHSLREEIRHVLLAKPRTKLGEITKIYSHEQAIGQCAEFLHSLGDKVQVEPCLNTAVAARLVSASDENGIAAIASPECADIYGLSVIKRRIADSDHNYTRFLCVAKEPEQLPGADRISLILSIPHEPGALARILDRFAENGINMLKIESMPIPGRDFEFLFYIDVEASAEEPAVQAILRELEETCPSYTFLGNYSEE